MAQTHNVKAFLDEHDIEHTVVPGGEYVVNPCPFCGTDKGKCYINGSKGLFDCKICGEKGNFFKFKKAYGVIGGVTSSVDKKQYKPLEMSVTLTAEQALLSNPEAMNYLHGRGFTDETIKLFRLGVAEHQWITIPHFSEDKLWNIKYRNFKAESKENRFKRVTGQPTLLFNLDNLDMEREMVVIVESETDAIAARQLGIINVVGLTAGAETFKPEWLSPLQQFNDIIICLNSDEVGQTGARKIADKIGLARARNAILPTNDVNDFLKEGRTYQELSEILLAAEHFSLEEIGNARELVDSLDDWLAGDGEIQGIPTGFQYLDHLTGGMKSEDLIVLSGDSGVGKTTLTLNVINNAINEGHNCLGFFLEGKVPYYFMRMMGINVEKPYDQLRDNPEQWDALKEIYSELPFFWYSGSQAELTPEKMREFLPAVVQLYDIKLVMIDNLQKYVRGSDTMYHQRVGEAVSVLKDLAVDLKIPIILISHITKRNMENKYITMHDAKSSSTIYQDADQFWIVQNLGREGYVVTLEKNRMGEGNLHIPFTVDLSTGVYKEGNVNVEKQGAVPVEDE